MSLYDALKDAVTMAQKADNVELYRQLLDLGAQALDLQSEVARLRAENAELKRKREVSDKVIRHEEPCITLKDDEQVLYYCSHCWDSNQLLIQLNCHGNGTFDCPHCHAKGNYSNEKKQRADKQQLEAIASFNRANRHPYNL